MTAPESFDPDLLEYTPKNVYQGTPDFGVALEGSFEEDPVDEVEAPPSSIPLPTGFPSFQLPSTPALPNIPAPKLDIPGIAAPSIPEGAFSQNIPAAPSQLLDKVQNDLGDAKPVQELAETAKSVVTFPTEPQAISKEIAKVAPQVAQDVVQDVIKNTLSLFLGVFVPGKAILDLILGIKTKADTIGSEILALFGSRLEEKVSELGTQDNLTEAMKNGLANSLNQAAGLSDMRQVPVGPRNPLSSDVPQHTVASDKANRADWPNGSKIPNDPLAGLGNAARMAEDMHNLAASTASLEKSAAVLSRSATMLAQGLNAGSLALQIDALLRAYSVNSVNVNGSLPSKSTLLKENNNAKWSQLATTTGVVESGKAKGQLTGTVVGSLAGTVADAEVSGAATLKGVGELSGQVTASIDRAELVGGTVNEDGSVTGGVLAVQSLSAVSLSNASGSVQGTGTVVGNVSGSFSGTAEGQASGNLTGSVSASITALETTQPAVVKDAVLQNASGSGKVAGSGTLTATGSVSGSLEGSLANGSLSGGNSAGGTIQVATITNPVFGPTGLLEGGQVTGVAQNLEVSGSLLGALTGTASGSGQGLQGSAQLSGNASLELTGGDLRGGTNLGNVPTTASALRDKLSGLKNSATGAMPGNLMDLAYGSGVPLQPGYLQALPGKVADALGSPNGRLIDEYMKNPSKDLDALTELLPELLLPGSETIQQLISALRALQEVVIYCVSLDSQTLDLLRTNVSSVGSDFIYFIEVVRGEYAQLGNIEKLATNYIRRSYTYPQRQLVRKFASLWDNLQTQYVSITNPTIRDVAEKVMTTRYRVFGR